MTSITNQNIFSEYCPSVLVQGMRCPARRKGEKCKFAHRRDEIFPYKCTREEGITGCSLRYHTTPLMCKRIHNDETKKEFTERLGFDPEHEKYNDYTSTQLYNTLVEIEKDTLKLKERHVYIVNERDIKKNNKAIHKLKIKKKFLNELLYEKTWLKYNLRWAVILCVQKARLIIQQQGEGAVCELLRRLSTVPSADNSTPHTESQVMRLIVEYVGISKG